MRHTITPSEVVATVRMRLKVERAFSNHDSACYNRSRSVLEFFSLFFQLFLAATSANLYPAFSSCLALKITPCAAGLLARVLISLLIFHGEHSTLYVNDHLHLY